MLVLSPTGRPREWLVAAANYQTIDSFRKSFDPRRGVSVVHASLSPPRGDPTGANANLAPPVKRLLNSRVNLVATSLLRVDEDIDEAVEVPPSLEDQPWSNHLRKTPSDSRISKRSLTTKRLVTSKSTCGSSSSNLLDDAELSLEVRLSRSSSLCFVDNQFRINESIGEVLFSDDDNDDPFQLPITSASRDGFLSVDDDSSEHLLHFDHPAKSPETRRLNSLATTTPPESSTGFFSSISSSGSDYNKQLQQQQHRRSRVFASASSSSGYDSMSTPGRGVGAGTSVDVEERNVVNPPVFTNSVSSLSSPIRLSTSDEEETERSSSPAVNSPPPASSLGRIMGAMVSIPKNNGGGGGIRVDNGVFIANLIPVCNVLSSGGGGVAEINSLGNEELLAAALLDEVDDDDDDDRRSSLSTMTDFAELTLDQSRLLVEEEGEMGDEEEEGIGVDVSKAKNADTIKDGCDMGGDNVDDRANNNDKSVHLYEFNCVEDGDQDGASERHEIESILSDISFFSCRGDSIAGIAEMEAEEMVAEEMEEDEEEEMGGAAEGGEEEMRAEERNRSGSDVSDRAENIVVREQAAEQRRITDDANGDGPRSDDIHGADYSFHLRPPSTPTMSDIAKHNIRVEKVSHLQYRCRWCHRSFTRSADCYHHFLKAHSTGKRRIGKGGGGSRGGVTLRDTPIVRLSNSHYSLHRGHQRQPQLHHHYHHNIRDYTCQFCDQIPEMHGSFFSTTTSSSSLSSRGPRLALKQHEECQHKVKDYRCLYCGKRFFYAVSLKAHVRGCHGGGSKGDLWSE